jgi:hypothetical protein
MHRECIELGHFVHLEPLTYRVRGLLDPPPPEAPLLLPEKALVIVLLRLALKLKPPRLVEGVGVLYKLV